MVSRPSRPYLGLARYRFADRNLFAGREEDIEDFTKLLDGSGKLFLLHGKSGCGKSSFLEAGLFPYLVKTQKYSFGSEGGEVSSRGLGLEIVRLGKRPFTQIASAIHGKIPEQAPPEARMPLERFRSRAWKEDQFLVDSLSALPFYFTPPRPFLMVVDQSEDIFQRNAEDEYKRGRDKFFRFLAQITVLPAFVQVIVSLRTDFKGRFDDELENNGAAFSRIVSHYLDELDDKSMKRAVLYPAKLCGFKFAKNVPDLLIAALKKLPHNQPALPVLQVICNRLYSYMGGGKEITEAHYRATGATNLQVGVYLEEKIVEFFITRRPRDKVDLAVQADRWRRALLNLVEISHNGRVRAKPPIRENVIRKWADEKKCLGSSEMIRWLAKPDQSILKEEKPDRLMRSSGGWRLVHDSLALALKVWSAESVIDAQATESRFLETPYFLSENIDADKLYTKKSECIFYTINDLIWDHQIHLFAQYKGFSTLLGLRFCVDSEFDLTKTKKHLNYNKFLGEKYQPSGPRFVVLPSSVFPVLKTKKWLTIAISNIYDGFALNQAA